MLNLHNIAGYKFITLHQLPDLRQVMLALCNDLEIKGTILLSTEGINISLAAKPESIAQFKKYLLTDQRFTDITFRESFSQQQSFKRMKVKLRKEIITMGLPEIKPELTPAPAILPAEFKQWIEQKQDLQILDTRNDYEVQFGTFNNAINLGMKDFGEFPEKAKTLKKDKPIVMFCTGGIRCEKAAVYLLNSGHKEVYQLQGGILNYFAEMGGAHYDGECFVFDGRVALDSNLKSTGAQQCCICQQPIRHVEDHISCSYN